MKISLKWLSDYIALPQVPSDNAQTTAEIVAHQLTQAGLEVEGIETVEQIKGGLKGVVVGQVLTCDRHPNADKLSVTTVDVGGEAPLAIVCGAPNVAAGQKVLVATEGAVLYPSEGEPFTIKKSKIRGEASQGMICAEDELGLGASHAGIMVLDTDLPNGTPAATYLGLDSDTVLEIGLTPNRADAASHYGVARDLKAILNLPITKPSAAKFVADGSALPVSVQIEAAEACPRYTATVLTNVKVGPSPKWLQQRLNAIGVNSINNVVDVTNYVLHGLGQPLHAFDLSKVNGRAINVRFAHEGETLVTLDGTERKLNAHNLVIADEAHPLAIAGVFGGLASGVTESTNEILLESAYFSPAVVRKSAQVHGLKTDASYLFERGTDPNMPVYAAQIAALLLQEVAGATIATEVNDVYLSPIPDTEFRVSYTKLFRLMGVTLEREHVHQILRNLDILVMEDSEYGHLGFADEFVVSVPPYRVDVTRLADIAEEVLRIYGLDNIPLKPYPSATYLAPQPINENDKLQFRTGAQLAAMGWQEMINNSLGNPALADLTTTQGLDRNVLMLNALSEDLAAMRQSLLFNGLASVAHNINRQQRNLQLFEFGKVYRLQDPEAEVVTKRYEEKWQLGLWSTGQAVPETWQAASQDQTYFLHRQAVQAVLFRLTGQTIVPQVLTGDDRFAYGQQWMLNKQVVCKAGMLSPKLAKANGIKQTVFYAEIDWQYLIKKYKTGLQAQEVPKFPAVRRDLSLVLDRAVTYDQVRQVALKTERKLLTDLNVFSVYEGANLGEGKKSYAIAFTLQSNEATLTDQQIDGTMTKLMQALGKELGAEIRS